MQVNTVIEGDCLEAMRSMPDNCIDTILTDPPYGLQFMGKDWDNLWRNKPGADKEYQERNSGKLTGRLRDLPDYSSTDQEAMQRWHYEWAKEALRVAKPGATLMAFGGTRTYHRLACAIEDAGWEIRDCISYFHDGNQAEMALMASLDEEQLAAYLELHYPNHQMAWCFGSGFPKSHNVSKAIDRRAGAEREVVGENIYSSRRPNPMNGNVYQYNRQKYDISRDLTITAPATPLDAKWDGWGSALKPSFEPIIVAQKPLDQNFAHNAERWGVAGYWIDGGRIETNGESLKGGAYSENGRIKPMNGDTRQGASLGMFETGAKSKNDFVNPTGRYPANVILDGSETVEAEFAKAGVRTSGNLTGQPRGENKIYGSAATTLGTPLYYTGDSGSASRYFAHCPPDPNCLTCTDCITEDKPTGRYPANVILDGSETVEAEFAKAGVSVSSDRPRHNTPNGVNKEHSYGRSKQNWVTNGHSDSGSASRYFAHCPPDTEPARLHYCPKAGAKERATPGNNHPTQKPVSLVKYLARLTKTPDGGLVLDPFAGSGTTALAAISEGRDYILIEKEPEYAELCRRRIAEYTGAEIVAKEIEVAGKTEVKQLGLW